MKGVSSRFIHTTDNSIKIMHLQLLEDGEEKNEDKVNRSLIQKYDVSKLLIKKK